METVPALDLDDAILPRSKHYSVDIKPNESKTKHKGVQDQRRDDSEDHKKSLGKNEIKYGVNYSFRKIKDEVWLVKQKNIALTTFDDKRRFIDR